MYRKISQSVKYFCWCYLIGNQLLIGADDFESRNTISYQVKLPQSFKIDFEQSLRLRGNQFSFRQTFTEATISYKVTDGLKLLLPLRYAIFEDKVKKRISFGGTYKYKFNDYTMRYKPRYQRVYEKDEDLEDLIRNKFTMQYKSNKDIDPFFSYEIFNPFNSGVGEMNEYRLSIGGAIDLPKKKSAKIYYLYKIEDLDKKNSEVLNIIGLSVSLN